MQRTGLLLAACVAGFALMGPALADNKPMPDNAREYIIWPADGQVISGGKFWIRMGLSNAGIAPAGIEKQYTGHHHLLIDTDLPPLDDVIPNDKNHLHFGLGQTEARIELPPGRHTLATAVRRRRSRSAQAAALFGEDNDHRSAIDLGEGSAQ